VRVLFLGLAFFGSYFSSNKILFIISAPRCLSSATFRMFAEREDFTGFHESSLAVYNMMRWPVMCNGWFHDEAFKTFDELQEKIFLEQKIHNVVLKEMIFTVREFVGENEAFLNNPDVHFLFLVRHPYWIVHSFEEKHVDDLGLLYELCGLDELYNLYQKAKKNNPNKVHLVFSDKLSFEPKRYLEDILGAMDLTITEESLNWTPYDKTFDGKVWHEQMTMERFHNWHGGALFSKTIYPLKRVTLPCEEEMFKNHSTEVRELLKKIYNYQLPYYHKFLEEEK